MASATLNYGFPYPTPTDPVDFTGDFKALADALDDAITGIGEISQDSAALMITSASHVNGISASYNDSTNKLSFTLAQNITTAGSPTFGSITLNGFPTATTAPVDNSSSRIATTEFVVNQGYLKSATASATYAPLISPTFSGSASAYTLSASTVTATQFNGTTFNGTTFTGNAATATTTNATVTGTNAADLVTGQMADNDSFRIRIGGTGSNAGFVEIATADDSTEPIYVRQYSGVFTSLTRTATILDESGNTLFPNVVSGSRFTSTVADGTAPLTITSTTLVSNLNADLLDGQHGAFYASASNAALTGVPTAPTASVDTNTTQVATTAFVIGQEYLKAVTASTLYAPIEEYALFELTRETENVSAGSAVLTFRAPYDITLTKIPRAALASDSNADTVIDINVSGSTIFTTNLTIDATEKTSFTAITPAVLGTTIIPEDAEIRFDVDSTGSGGKGLKVILYYKRT